MLFSPFGLGSFFCGAPPFVGSSLTPANCAKIPCCGPKRTAVEEEKEEGERLCLAKAAGGQSAWQISSPP